jgi:hypothetical protein
MSSASWSGCRRTAGGASAVGSPVRLSSQPGQVRLNRSVESARHVLAYLTDVHPLHRVQLVGIRHACSPGEHVAGDVGQVRRGVWVDPVAKYPHWPDGEAGLLEHYPDRGSLGALTRLELAAGQDPRRGLVVCPATNQGPWPSSGATVKCELRSQDALAFWCSRSAQYDPQVRLNI